MLMNVLLVGKINAQQSASRFSLRASKDDKRIEVWCDGKLFTAYVYPDQVKKPVLYPIYTSTGILVTRGWPLDPRPGERVDHPHHVGSWFNYGDVNGIDFWNNSDNVGPDPNGHYGKIVHFKVNKMESGNNRGVLEVSMFWKKADGTDLIKEDTRFVFSGTTNTRVIDRITTLTALKDISFTDNKEGLFAMRVARFLEHPSNQPEKFTDASGKVTNVAQLNNDGVTGLYHSSEGIEGEKVWGTRARWVSLTGKSGDEQVAVIMMDHPANVGYPAYWHARGYGLFAANNLGQKAMSEGKEELNYKLPAGKSVTFKHRLVVASGQYSNQQISQQFSNFSKVK